MKTKLILTLFIGAICGFLMAQDKPKKNIQPTIPMDIGDPNKDLWKTFREDLQGDRPPGLINIQRLYGGTGFMGMPTFFQTDVALTPADLEAGNVDVAIMGGLTDMGAGFA